LPESKHQQVEGLPFTETHKRTKVLHKKFTQTASESQWPPPTYRCYAHGKTNLQHSQNILSHGTTSS